MSKWDNNYPEQENPRKKQYIFSYNSFLWQELSKTSFRLPGELEKKLDVNNKELELDHGNCCFIPSSQYF